MGFIRWLLTLNREVLSTVGKQQVSYLFFPGAAAGSVPLAIELKHLFRLNKIRQLRQCRSEHRSVLIQLSGTAESATHRMVDENGTWRWNLVHDVENRADHKGRDAAALDDMGDETDGLVAKGSVGYQQGKVDAGLL